MSKADHRIESFERKKRRWELPVFSFGNQSRYQCPFCSFDTYSSETALKHLEMEHLELVTHNGDQLELIVFFSKDGKIYKCPTCPFQGRLFVAVFDHCNSEHTRRLSDRDAEILETVGEERFKSLTNAEIRRDSSVRDDLRQLGLRDANTAKTALDRVRRAMGYPLSRQIKKSRSH